VKDKVAEITRKAMEEGLDFSQALKERVTLLKGLEEKALIQVWNKLTFKPTVCDLFRLLHKHE
jgi:phosphoserine phosphatase